MVAGGMSIQTEELSPQFLCIIIFNTTKYGAGRKPASLRIPSSKVACCEMGLLRRSSPVVVTQTLTDASGSISTAFVTLGPASSSLATNSYVTLASSTLPTQGPAGGTNHVYFESNLTQNQVGAILGSIVGFFVMALAVWYCVSSSGNTSGKDRSVASSYYYYGSSYGAGSSSRSSSRRKKRKRRRRDKEWRSRPVYTYGPGVATVNLQPPMIPPAAKTANYRQTADPQIPGVSRYP